MSRRAPTSIRRGLFLTACTLHRFLGSTLCFDHSQQPKGWDGVLSSLNMAIDALNLVEELSSILLTIIKVRFILFCDTMLQVHT